MQRVFREFDEDGSGSLDTEEIEQVMAMFNITPFRSTVLSAIAVVDEDSTGVVEFHEFVHLLTIYKKTEGFKRHSLDIGLKRGRNSWRKPLKSFEREDVGSGNEVKDLYTVFYKFAVRTMNSQLREIPSSRLRAALMQMQLRRH